MQRRVVNRSAQVVATTLVVTGLTLGSGGAAKTRSLSGTLAYIRQSYALVAPAAGGAETRIPQSHNARLISISPATGAVVFFADIEHGNGIARGFVSLPPYRTSRPLAPPFDAAWGVGVIWSASGKVAYLFAETSPEEIVDDAGTSVVHASLDPTANKLQVVPRSEAVPWQVSHDQVKSRAGNSTSAWLSGKRLLVSTAGKTRTVFSGGRPEPLFRAVARSAFARRFEQERRDGSWRRKQEWQIGPPGLTPDGRAVYYATNAGNPIGASGATAWCLFRADLRRNTLTVVPTPHPFIGSRLPDTCEVSPDGKRLMLRYYLHGSAIEGRTRLQVLDLLSHRMRNLAGWGLASDSSHQEGPPHWSPDGRFVVYDEVRYQSTPESTRFRLPDGKLSAPVPTQKWDAASGHYSVRIVDAIAGGVVRTIPGAYRGSWSAWR